MLKTASFSSIRVSFGSAADAIRELQELPYTRKAVMETALAEDYVNLTPTGAGPRKAALLQNFREHAGEAPPYSVRRKDMNIFVLNDASAVAAYVKIYVAKENKNVAREDTTHVFTKKDGTWKLRVSRASNSVHDE